jgi:hypothetical protein
MLSHEPLSAPRADSLYAKQAGERTGSRPQPPKAGARSASLEAGRSPAYLNNTVAPLRVEFTPSEVEGRSGRDDGSN